MENNNNDFDLFFANEWTTHIDRPKLNKEQLKEWMDTIYNSNQVDEFIDVVSAINARLIHDLENNIPTCTPSRYEDFLGKRPISVLTDEHIQRYKEKILQEEHEALLREQKGIELCNQVERQDLINILEEEIGREESM